MWTTIKGLLPNPYVILAFVLAIVGTFFYGKHVGTELTEAQVLRDEMLAERVYQAAQQGAASATVKVDVIQKTIQNQAKEIIREVPVYRDCVNTPDMQRLLDAARADRLPTPNPSGSGELPKDTPAGQP